jgi:hypothetical protein
MLGKKSARAAPMLALAAFSWCSASMTSGRRSNRAEGSPTARSARSRRGAKAPATPPGSSAAAIVAYRLRREVMRARKPDGNVGFAKG